MEDGSDQTIAANLNIALGTVHNVNCRFIETEDVMPKKYLSGQNWGHELFIVRMIIDRPSHYLCYATL